ncbi:UV excision repair protein RAD23 isoform 2 [Schistosoma japonicum]|uniref:UV excision repair protein RAD23 isoform 2 n=1 Tax=Schistosoma japonicum TaxID=6182 RepID=A0A4Z2D7H6_SCHJA|nr:UV excision repair protein RAD23 isoform 2 [Schistosoma japonicum]
MKVTFKTLKQQTFVLDLQEDDLVGDVKKKIEAERGSEFDASTQKLIHSGKVMEDSKSLKDYKVTDSGFVVVMSVSKPAKEGSASAPGNPAGEGRPTTDKKIPDVDVTESPSSKPDANSQPSLPTVTTTQSTTTNTLGFGESSLVTGENFERVVQELVSMGFEKPLVSLSLNDNGESRSYEQCERASTIRIEHLNTSHQETFRILILSTSHRKEKEVRVYHQKHLGMLILQDLNRLVQKTQSQHLQVCLSFNK